jgi:putative chitinase
MSVDRIGDTQLIIDECVRYGCTRQQTAYILATAFWETARTMRPVEEAFWLSDEWRKANLRYYPWHGRGYVQITWERNYKLAAEKLKAPIDLDPTMALEPKYAVQILVTGCMEGWFSGKKLPDYISASQCDFVNARKVVNGKDKAVTIAAIAHSYDEALKLEGY